MKKLIVKNKLFLLVAPLLLLTTCVDPIEFNPRDEDDFLVVDGRMTDGDGPHVVKLTRTEIVGRSSNFPTETGAQISVIENGDKEYFFNEIDPGKYQLEGVPGVPGNSYQLRIRLSNGILYESNPEILPPQIQPDSVFFEFDRIQTISVFSQLTIPGNIEKGPYLKWQFDHAYQITDLVCNPFDVATICYFQFPRDNQLLPLLDGSGLARGGMVKQLLSEVEVFGTVFGEKNYFTVVQESITADAYEYWSRVARLISQNGSIFDNPPGGIRGNIFRTDEPNELVLGYFYAASERTDHIPTLPSDFVPLTINPYCGVPGLPPQPFPEGCCFCSFLVKNQIEKPDFWR